MSFDFQNATLPQLVPLKNSFAVDEVENELRNLFIDLFATYLAESVFDSNVLGMAHLGTFGLVKKSINVDGLVLISGSREERATRYVYRAWKSRNLQGRGLAFLKTYLQVLYPGAWNVEQQMQETAEVYPTALHNRSFTENDADKYLTSRVKIELDAFVVGDVSYLPKIINSIIPARLVPYVTSIAYSSSSEGVMIFAALAQPGILLRSSGSVLPLPN